MSQKHSESSPPAGVGLVQKTLQIFDLFQTDAPHWSQAEIAMATGIPKSTVSRLVKFLTDCGYFTLLHGQNRYSLGPASIDLGRRASALFDFRALCRPVLEWLSQETQETVILTSVVGTANAVRCVDQIESTREGLRVFEQIGNVFPLHAGAAPKAVLSAMRPEEITRYLSRQLVDLTDKSPTDPDRLRHDIAQAQQQGYAVSNGETYEGVAGIGAAFFWKNGRPAGSIAIAMPSQRATEQTIHHYGQLLQDARQRVDALLSATENLDLPRSVS